MTLLQHYSRTFQEEYNEENLDNWNEHFKNVFGVDTVNYKDIDAAELNILNLQGFTLEDYLPKQANGYSVCAGFDYWVCTERGEILKIIASSQLIDDDDDDDDDNKTYYMTAEYIFTVKLK